MLNNMLDANAVTSATAALLSNTMATNATFAEDSYNANVTLTNYNAKNTLLEWSQTTTPTTTTTTKTLISSQSNEIDSNKNTSKEITATIAIAEQSATTNTTTTTTTTATITATTSTTTTTAACSVDEASGKRSSLSRAKSHVADFTIGTLREFRGVQSLRHLWNKRISANELLNNNTHLAHTNNSSGSHSKPGSKLNKSISCLLDATAQQQKRDQQVAEQAAEKTELLRRRALAKRTHSLYDLNATFGKTVPSLVEPPTEQPEIDSFHREKDNFYKYKTAEQAAKQLAQQTKARANGRRLNAGIACSSTDEDAHFPAVNASERGERIHWAKRQDILPRKQRTEQPTLKPTDATATSDVAATMVINEIRGGEMSHLTGSSLRAAESTKCLSASSDELINVSSLADTPNDKPTADKTSCATRTRADSPQKASPKRSSEREGTALNKRDSNDSASTTASISACRTVRRTGSSTTRKYSFKTHTHARSYHLPRKMSGANKDSHNAGNGFSMVAKLTQQFNEIIQKDKKLLEEVKRKNGVLMARNGHVYKVLPSIGERHKSNASTPSAASPTTLSRNSSHAKDAAVGLHSTVQRNIKKFEKGANSAPTELTDKPKVPAKSAQVLKKRNELVSIKHTHAATINNNNNNNNNSNNKRAQLKLPTQLLGQEDAQPSAKKSQHLLTATALEVVTEEAKTPLESDDKVEPPLQATKATAKIEQSATLPHTQQSTAAVGDDAVGTTAMPSLDELDVASGDKVKQRKHRYAMIYEKFRFRSPFKTNAATNASNRKEPLASAALEHNKPTTADAQLQPLKQQQSVDETEKMTENAEQPAQIKEPLAEDPKRAAEVNATAAVAQATAQPIAVSATAISATDVLLTTVAVNAEAKILDALEAVDHKLKALTHDNDDAMLLCGNDDFEQRILPNSSFIYTANAKHTQSNAGNTGTTGTTGNTGNQPLLVTQAVNVALVNAIEGEQMIMEQKELQAVNAKEHSAQLPQAVLHQHASEEPLYEPIDAPSEVPSAAATTEDATDDATASTLKATMPQPSFVHCNAGKSQQQSEPEDIYQTLDDVKASIAGTATSSMTLNATAPKLVTANQQGDYESIAGSTEAKLLTLATYDGYESFAPPESELFARSASTSSVPPTTPTTPLSRNTNDELPELPKPKRRLPKSPMPGKRPPRPKPLHCTTVSGAATEIQPSTSPSTQMPDEQHYYADDDDENIYDTIKGSSCYESLTSAQLNASKLAKSSVANGAPSQAPIDTISLNSNCYESIIHYRRAVTSGASVISSCSQTACSNSGSTLTISSDHKTNSLYEGSLAAYNARRRSTGSGTLLSASIVDVLGANIACSASDTNSLHYKRLSIATSSDNSDEWIDISDAELDIHNTADSTVIKQKFIVVRERFKKHNSPDWSKRVRDKRLNQKHAVASIEDDSDHYYESLSPLGNKRQSLREVKRTHSHHKRNQDLPRYVGTGIAPAQRCKKYAGTHASDDYDSFDTDTDEIYETEESMRNHNDSGVDICHVKQLPEPPSSTNQVYAIVKKFKNFISNKKSTGSKQAAGNGPQKIYENTSQFYVEGNVYENTPKAKVKHTKSLKKSQKPAPQADIYENTDFHSPPALPSMQESKPLSVSDKNLSAHASNNDLPGQPSTATLRAKSKNGKSLRSRLRKSLVGSTFDSKALSTLTSTRSTFYIEDPSHCDTGELDSGFSEKASSGDLPTTGTTSTTNVAEEAPNFCTVRKPKKDAKSINAQRRRTTIGIRPHEPPPPPPPATGDAIKNKLQPGATTSWYAECGVFKNSSANIGLDESSLNGSKSTNSQNGSLVNGTSWYAEAGLYQTSGASVASSSGSSGVSTGNEAGLGDDLPHSMFLNEPLYQIYSAAKLESISRDMEENDSSTDGYEEIGQNGVPKHGQHDSATSQKRPRPTALQLIEPKNGPSRTLWSEISEVINSGILPTLTPRERALQEAKFEIITSEASYLKSLNLLRSHFMNNASFRDTTILNPRDRKALFSYIVPVHECSERLLTELESCWQDNIMLLGLSKRIYDIAEKQFHVYISFCEHQGRMDRTLRRLKETKGTFSAQLETLESSPTCCGLNLHSFLMLPMQRITRLPLLIDAVFSKVTANDDEYENWKLTLAIMNKIVTQCNEAANRCEQAYEIERISRQLEFPTTIRALAIAPVGVPVPGAKPRFLVKKGELTHLIWRGDDAKLTFGKKFTKSSIYAFLFSDLLVLTKRKSDEQFLVFDYCPRNMLTISSGHLLPQLPTKDMGSSGKHLILMTLLENNERKTVELVLSCPSISEQERWLQAMRPPEAETPGEKLYEPWDCPQVIVKHSHASTEPDVLNLDVGDVINVTRKLPDGWYQGERIRDGAVGWFPGSYTEEVNSAHVRARNLKQRYRLLTFTATYLESQKRK